MTEPWCLGLSPDQECRIKRAVESTCELCREYTPLSLLLLHGLPSRGRNRNSPKEREKNILVVCDTCHRLIHAEPVPVKKLRALIAARPFTIRREILLALGYVPKAVSIPKDLEYRWKYD